MKVAEPASRAGLSPGTACHAERNGLPLPRRAGVATDVVRMGAMRRRIAPRARAPGLTAGVVREGAGRVDAHGRDVDPIGVIAAGRLARTKRRILQFRRVHAAPRAAVARCRRPVAAECDPFRAAILDHGILR